jgi:phosphoribosyl-AMP cyclohydrolase
MDIAKEIKWNKEGLVPVVVQCHESGKVLMLAWMNREALANTLKTGKPIYWSRSRKSLWRKGETSGQTQTLKELLLDCDGDTLLAKVVQKGVACHTGRSTCFFKKLGRKTIRITEKPTVDPAALYGKPKKKKRPS